MAIKMKTSKKAIIFAICYIAYVSIYVARLNLSMASPGLIADGTLTKSQLGVLGSIFSVIYASGRLINGGISDHKPPFLMICAGLFIAGGANLAFGAFPPFVGMMILWSANAWAQSMLWSSILCVISELHDESAAKKLTSYMVTAVAAGNVAGIIVNTAIITKLGNSFAFIIPGGFTIIMGIAAFISIRKLPSPKPKEGKKPESVTKLLKNRELLTAAIPAAFHGVMKDNISLFMAVYFVESFGIDLEKSAYFVLFIPVVGFVGRMLYPFVYKISGEREHLVSILGFALCLISSLPLCLGVGTPVIAMICLGLIYASVSLINTSFLSIYPLHFASEGHIASVSGIMDFVTYLGAGISSMIYGIVGYLPMFVSWAVVSVISILLLTSLLKRANKG